jgi:hypothetical protein
MSSVSSTRPATLFIEVFKVIDFFAFIGEEIDRKSLVVAVHEHGEVVVRPAIYGRFSF